VLPVRSRFLGRPADRIGDQARVDGLPHVGDPSGEAERAALLLADCGVGPDHRRQVHHDAGVRPDDQLRTHDGELEVVRQRLLLQVVLLQPVEVGVRITLVTLTRRDTHRVQVDAVGLGPLQDRDVLERGDLAEGLEEVSEHRQVRLHLVLLGPPCDQAGLLEHSRVDDVRDRGEVGHAGAGRRFVAEVEWEMFERLVARDLGLAT